MLHLTSNLASQQRPDIGKTDRGCDEKGGANVNVIF